MFDDSEFDGGVCGHKPIGKNRYDLGSWVTALLIHKYGEEAYLNLYDDVEGIGFEEAFVKSFGISSKEFLDEFHDEFLELPLEEQLKIIP